MPINPQKALAAKFATIYDSYDEDDVILYHLGIGAGVPSTDAGELEYTYEKDLKVLPTFGVIPVVEVMNSAFKIPGLDYDDIDHNMVLHGEHEIEVHRPLPRSANIESETRIKSVYDKGKAALVVVEVATSERGGALMYTNRFSMFLRGSGGFGGETGPPAVNTPQNRKPDQVIETQTLPQLAAIYRMTGDKNPLHIEPEFAKQGGWHAPILQGLCTYGIVCKAAVDHTLGGDVTRIGNFRARFTGVVFPGDTILTSLWEEDDRILISATTKERGDPVISNCAITVKQSGNSDQ